MILIINKNVNLKTSPFRQENKQDWIAQL